MSGPLLVFETWKRFFDWVYPAKGENREAYKGDIQIAEEPEIIYTSVMEVLHSCMEPGPCPDCKGEGCYECELDPSDFE